MAPVVRELDRSYSILAVVGSIIFGIARGSILGAAAVAVLLHKILITKVGQLWVEVEYLQQFRTENILLVNVTPPS